MPDGADATIIGWFEGDDVEVPGTIVDVTSEAVLTLRDEQLELSTLEGRSVATFPIELPLLASAHAGRGVHRRRRGRRRAPAVVLGWRRAAGRDRGLLVDCSRHDVGLDRLADEEADSVTAIDPSGEVTASTGSPRR